MGDKFDGLAQHLTMLQQRVILVGVPLARFGATAGDAGALTIEVEAAKLSALLAFFLRGHRDDPPVSQLGAGSLRYRNSFHRPYPTPGAPRSERCGAVADMLNARRGTADGRDPTAACQTHDKHKFGTLLRSTDHARLLVTCLEGA